MERYEESYECYRALMKGHHDDYGLERQANMAAVVAMMHSIGSQKVVSPFRFFLQLLFTNF